MSARRLALALAWLPGLLCAAAWPLSNRHPGYVRLRSAAILVEYGATYVVPPRPDEVMDAGLGDPRGPTVETWSGVAVQRWKPWRVVYGMTIVPLWVPSLALAVPPLWLTRRSRR